MRLSAKFFLTALLLSTSSIALGQNQPGQIQQNFTQPPLFRMNDVSKSLNLTQDQISRLNQATDRLETHYRQEFDKLSSLNSAARDVRTRDLQQRFNADLGKSTVDILNQDQRSRYQQLEMQFRGFGAFIDADFQRRLNLTAEQQQRIQQANEWSQQQLADINRRGQLNAEVGMRLYQDYLNAYQQRYNNIFSEAQQRTLRGMTGEPFRFQPPFANKRK